MRHKKEEKKEKNGEYASSEYALIWDFVICIFDFFISFICFWRDYSIVCFFLEISLLFLWYGDFLFVIKEKVMAR